MKTSKPYILSTLILLFFLGLYVYSTQRIETFFGLNDTTFKKSDKNEPTCPTILVQEGSELLLFDPKQPKSDKNPLKFNNLDEYIKFTQQNTMCPMLYLQPGSLNDAINQITSYTPDKPGPVLDASRDNPPFNQGNYAGFDPINLFVGKYTELDKIHDSTGETVTSPNPLDTNWGGVQYTQYLIDKGVYVENNVSPPHLIEARNSGVIV